MAKAEKEDEEEKEEKKEDEDEEEEEKKASEDFVHAKDRAATGAKKWDDGKSIRKPVRSHTRLATHFKKGEEMEVKEAFETLMKAGVLDAEEIEVAGYADIMKADGTENIVKAEVPDEIKKAVDEIAVIKKAFETEIEALKAEIKKIQDQPIVKAAVIIPEQMGSETSAPNYKAIEEFTRK